MTLVVGRNPRKSALTLKLEARAEEVPCTHRCLCGYSVTGPTGQAREQLRAHRISEHPERPAIAKRPKRPKPPKLPPTPPPDIPVSRANGRPKESIVKIGRPATVKRDELHRLYVEEGLSIRACADRLGVWHSTIRLALDRYEIPRRPYTPRDQSYVSSARESAAWRLYEQGHTGQEIAEVACDLWGYRTVKQCRRSLYEQFARKGRQLRPAWRRSDIPKFSRDDALEILKEAE